MELQTGQLNDWTFSGEIVRFNQLKDKNTQEPIDACCITIRGATRSVYTLEDSICENKVFLKGEVFNRAMKMGVEQYKVIAVGGHFESGSCNNGKNISTRCIVDTILEVA